MKRHDDDKKGRVQQVTAHCRRCGLIIDANHLHGSDKACIDALGEALAGTQENIDKFWTHLSRSYDIEDRAYFEREAPETGDWSPLQMALHHVWKREPKVEALEQELRDARAAIDAPQDYICISRAVYTRLLAAAKGKCRVDQEAPALSVVPKTAAAPAPSSDPTAPPDPRDTEIETLRLQLAGCSVIAGANTRESAAEVRAIDPALQCAALQDVAKAVDREMDLREQLTEAIARVEHANALYHAIVNRLRPYFPPGSRDLDWGVLPTTLGRLAADHAHLKAIAVTVETLKQTLEAAHKALATEQCRPKVECPYAMPHACGACADHDREIARLQSMLSQRDSAIRNFAALLDLRMKKGPYWKRHELLMLRMDLETLVSGYGGSLPKHKRD